MQSSILRGNTHPPPLPNDSSALASTRLRFCLIIRAPETYSTYKIHFPSPLISYASSLALNIYNGHSRDNSGLNNKGEKELLEGQRERERESKGNLSWFIRNLEEFSFERSVTIRTFFSLYRKEWEWNFYSNVLMISTGSNKDDVFPREVTRIEFLFRFFIRFFLILVQEFKVLQQNFYCIFNFFFYTLQLRKFFNSMRRVLRIIGYRCTTRNLYLCK